MHAKYPDTVAASTRTVCARSGLRTGHREDRPTVPGTDLCGPCHNRFAVTLRDLVRTLSTLENSVVRQPTKDYARDRVAGGSPTDVTAMWRPEVTDAKAELIDFAHYLGRTLERDYPGEAGVSERTDPAVLLAAAAKWHARWLSGYPGLGPDFLDDALRHLAESRRAMNATPVKRIRINDWVCSAVVEHTPLGDIECGADLVAIIRPTDDDADGMNTAQILCTVNPQHPRYPAKAWLDAQT